MTNQLFYLFYSLSEYPFFLQSAYILSYPMKYIIPLMLIVWILFKAQNKRTAFLMLAVSSTSTWLVVSFLKIIFAVDRPYILLNLQTLYTEASYSFPSNHAAFFAALAFASFYLNKKLGIVLSIAALFIGLSRIVLGVHTPLDVGVGFCIGILVSFVCVKLIEKYDHIT